MDEAAIQHDCDLATSPGAEHVLNDWLIERASGDVLVFEPASYLHNASSRLCWARNMISDLAQMHNASLYQSNDDPDPIGDAREVGIGMQRAQHGEDLRV
jgi:hypothetical protein